MVNYFFICLVLISKESNCLYCQVCDSTNSFDCTDSLIQTTNNKYTVQCNLNAIYCSVYR